MLKSIITPWLFAKYNVKLKCSRQRKRATKRKIKRVRSTRRTKSDTIDAIEAMIPLTLKVIIAQKDTRGAGEVLPKSLLSLKIDLFDQKSKLRSRKRNDQSIHLDTTVEMIEIMIEMTVAVGVGVLEIATIKTTTGTGTDTTAGTLDLDLPGKSGLSRKKRKTWVPT